MMVIKEPYEFQWDLGNNVKNLLKHNVSRDEAEQVFWDPNKRFFYDTVHSMGEKRYVLLGQTALRRILYVVFTMRGNKIRVISARDLNHKEFYLYRKS